MLGGLVTTVLVVPFTATHGPTSVNEERVLLGMDMHGWGLLLSVVPTVLLSFGLWRLRARQSGVRRGFWTTAAAAMLLSSGMDLAFGGLGPPFVLFVLAPLTAAAAATARPETVDQRRVRRALVGLSGTYVLAVALALIPLETSDAYAGYRVFCLVAYGLGGIAWAALGAASLRLRPGPMTQPTP